MALVLFETFLFVISSALVVIYLINKFYKKTISFSLRDIDYKLYYYKDLNNGKEHISHDLKKLLGMSRRDNRFENLLSCVKDDNKNSLKDLHAKLCSSFSSNKINVIRDIDLAIKIQLKKNSNSSGVVYLSSQYLVLRDKDRFGKAFFLFFADITKERVEIDVKQREKQDLELNFNRFVKLANHVHFPMWIRNKKGGVLYCNKIFDKNISEHFKDIDFTEELPLNFQKTIFSNNKKFVYKFSEYKSDANNYFYGYANDISDKVETQRDVRKYAQSLSTLIEASSNAFAIYGPDRRLLFYNEPFIKLWGLEKEFLDSNPLYEDIIDRLRDRRLFPENLNFTEIKRERVNFFKDLITSHNEYLFLPDGRTLRMVIVHHAFGGLIFCYEDMTDRYALESSYKTLSAVQKKTINNISDGIVVFGSNGKLALSNPKFFDIWKITQLLEGSHYKDFFLKLKKVISKNDYTSLERGFLQSFNKRVFKKFEVKTIDKAIIKITITALPDGATLMSAFDITDSKLLEDSLREKNRVLSEVDKLKSEFLSNISYELRSPLTSIMGFSEILKNEFYGSLNKKQKSYMERIEKSSNDLLKMVSEIIDLASIEAGHLELVFEKVKLSHLFEMVFVDNNKIKIDESISVKVDKKYFSDALRKIKSFIDKYNTSKELEISCLDSKDEYKVIISKLKFDDKEALSLFKQDTISNSDISMKFSDLSIARTVIDLHNSKLDLLDESSLVIAFSKEY